MNTSFSLRHLVKLAAIAATLGAAGFAAPSFAAGTATPSPLTTQAAASTQALAQTDMQVHQKTRAEVYQELVTAEKSGELARLNATYAGN